MGLVSHLNGMLAAARPKSVAMFASIARGKCVLRRTLFFAFFFSVLACASAVPSSSRATQHMNHIFVNVTIPGVSYFNPPIRRRKKNTPV